MYHSMGTFSMQTVLNQPLDPNLRKRILEEIKSPLLQQSFAMTNDDSFLSQSWINPPKRPNIPPPSYSRQHHNNQSRSQHSHSKRPNIVKTKPNSDNKSWQLSESFYDFNQNNGHYHQSYRNTPYEERGQFLQQGITNRFETSISDFNRYTFEVNNNNNKSTHIKNERSNNNAVQSIVSPLDPSITQRIQDKGKRLNIWSKFCGALFNTRQQARHEFEWERLRHERKKIFDAKGKSLLEKIRHYNNQHTKKLDLLSRRAQSILLPNYRPSHISVKDNAQLPQFQQQLKELNLNQVLLLLKQSPNSHNQQLAQFINLICQIMQLLSKAQMNKKLLLQNMELVYQLTTSEEDMLAGVNIATQEQLGNFFQRMNFTSLTDMIRKLSKNSMLQRKNIDVKEYQQQKNNVGEALERMLAKYEQVERLIEDYVRRKGSIEGLRAVYKLMMDKFSIDDNTKSTLQLLQRMLNDMKLYKYLPQIHFLEYIWSNFNNTVLLQQQFIICMVRIQGIYRSKESYQGYQNMLETLGKIRNNHNNMKTSSGNKNRLQIELQKMGYERNC